MLKSLQGKLAPTLYVQLTSEQIRITNVKTAQVLVERPLLAWETDAKGIRRVLAVGSEAAALPAGTDRQVVNPFDHPRTLLADFILAETFLQTMLKKAVGKRHLAASPRVIMHPMEKLEGGLTAVEQRGFRELALGAGAHDVCVYTGATLLAEQLDFAALKLSEQGAAESSAARGGFSSAALMLLSLGALGLLLWFRAQGQG